MTALTAQGPTPLHRHSWAFMDNLGWSHLRTSPGSPLPF